MTKKLLMLSAAVAVLAIAATGANAAKLGEKCGGVAGIACESGLWCEKAPGQCKTADALGTCVKQPDMCYELYQPVCGCNGKTYSNDCVRRRDRISKDHDGAC